MNQPDHTPVNRIIAAAIHDDSVGFRGNHTIARVNIELPREAPANLKVRTVCLNKEGQVLDVSDAGSIIDLAAYLGREWAVSRQYLMDRYEFRMGFEARQAAAENFSLEEDVKSGLLMQFVAGGVVYSIVRQGAYIIVSPNDEDRLFPALYTVIAQSEGDEDPDTAKILEESYDTQFEAITRIRNLIEKDLFQAFMPEACK